MENANQNNQQGMPTKKTGTANRGFASMKPEQQREIASKGGQAAHKQGVAHKWTAEEAREAGRKGGQASHSNRGKNSLSSNNDRMQNDDLRNNEWQNNDMNGRTGTL